MEEAQSARCRLKTGLEAMPCMWPGAGRAPPGGVHPSPLRRAHSAGRASTCAQDSQPWPTRVRDYRLTLSEDPSRSLVKIDVDFCDQAKFKCPRNVDSSKATESLWRPQLHLGGCLVWVPMHQPKKYRLNEFSYHKGAVSVSANRPFSPSPRNDDNAFGCHEAP